MKKKPSSGLIVLSLLLALAGLTGVLVVIAHSPASAAIRESTASVSAKSMLGTDYGTYARGIVDVLLGDSPSANGDGVTIDGTTVTIGAAGIYRLKGTLTDGQIVVNTKGKVYLEFSGVHVTSSSGPALLVKDAKKVTLVMHEGTENSLADAAGHTEYDAALYANDTLVIEGKGGLTVTGNNNEGISCDDDLRIDAGTISITAVDDGLNAHDDITITGGKITIAARGDALDSNGTIHLEGGTLLAMGSTVEGDGGLDAIGAVTITGGAIVASGNAIALPGKKSTQFSLYVSTGSVQPAGTTVIVTRNGKKIMTVTPTEEYENMLISSDKLLDGMTYDVYVGSATVPISGVAAKSPAQGGGQG